MVPALDNLARLLMFLLKHTQMECHLPITT